MPDESVKSAVSKDAAAQEHRVAQAQILLPALRSSFMCTRRMGASLDSRNSRNDGAEMPDAIYYVVSDCGIGQKPDTFQ